MFKSTPMMALALAAIASLQVDARLFTVTNKCSYTIWPAVYTGNTAQGTPSGIASQGGWQLDAGQSSSFGVPDNWQASRIWGRSECDFSKPDVSSCATGSCIGGLHCTQPGIPPATLAEFTLSQQGQDNYDVSLVDGANIPMAITANGCHTASCPINLNPNCPAPLQTKDASGNIVGCLSACKALGGDNNCCSGADDTPAKCPSSGVEYYSYFKQCKDAYAYAYDESSGTALWTCSGGHDYTITFCP
ncbi:thaumatin-like protein [Meira miltonrushii]|uniref:Thaumatin-like protein n=1 Tax=Meira miltonrushii TaxID=1280837 RepID=A0A316VA46_9BASI|nr:thaumatin-like protein [Meira miltonrushii]PWN34332.1 thaumatin-like protein [Meira miltonrushii]